jgi:hypothetical protein
MKTLLGLLPLHSAIFKMATVDFPDLLTPSDSMLPLEVFDRKHLVEYWNIPLERYGYLKFKHGFLPMA